MLWEVEIRPLGRDAERERVCDEFDLLTHSTARRRPASRPPPAASCSKANLDRDAEPNAWPTSCWSIRSSRSATLPRGRQGKRRPGVHRAAQARRHGPGRAERPRRGRMTSGCRSTAVRTFRRYFGTPELLVARPRRAVPQGAGQRRHRAGRRGPAAGRPPRRSARRTRSSSSPCRCATSTTRA